MFLFLFACQNPTPKTEDTGFENEPSVDTVDTGIVVDTSDTSEDTDSGVDTAEDSGEDTSTPIEEGPVFSFVRKEHIGGTNIWSNLVSVGDEFLFSTMQQNLVAFRRYDADLEILSEYMPISEPNDFPASVDVSDHKVILVDDALFFAISGFGDRDLVLVKTDLDGNRLGFYRVQDNIPNVPTNDMHLFAVDGEICLRWGASGFYKTFQCFLSDLTPAFPSVEVELPEPISQLGASLQLGSSIVSITGDGAQRNLIMSHYDQSYQPQEPFVEVILESEDDSWNWFSSGVAYHPQYHLWFIAYTTMASDGSANSDSVVEVAAFTDDFQLVDHRILSEPSFTRPNLTILGDSVLIGYDNQTEVYLERWAIIPPLAE